ncbi:MAG TPA: methionine biosynthesis protein MetW [Spirochaetota bacterium]|nr:methionine biosynthesis protein MetW [Spirochaetota bacterium]HNT13030.1 methionine biosynthesis protein MetW [Spirochaetota bacterium]HNV47510.1 methionine biosynthesis protein MetW [Spirochaetota bacterium]HOS40845.1 methionine biosynthesis protein MetW [Spirochaetota bacterium]HPI24257.1 methionine biosynthesis protein MetW [Spirochaetota bacterium]
MSTTRIGYDLIIEEIPERSRVLDLGCGDGELLTELADAKRVNAYGVEISAEGVSRCLEKGLYVYQGDIDEGLADYRSGSFDYVILNQTLQDTKRPLYVITESLRIGRFAIVSFPNLGYAANRFQLMFRGVMPKNHLFSYNWYDTPNIHIMSIRNFSELCRENRYPIQTERHFSMRPHGSVHRRRVFPNLFAEYGFFILRGRDAATRPQETS